MKFQHNDLSCFVNPYMCIKKRPYVQYKQLNISMSVTLSEIFVSGPLNISIWHLLAPFYVVSILNGSVGRCNVNELHHIILAT